MPFKFLWQKFEKAEQGASDIFSTHIESVNKLPRVSMRKKHNGSDRIGLIVSGLALNGRF